MMGIIYENMYTDIGLLCWKLSYILKDGIKEVKSTWFWHMHAHKQFEFDLDYGRLMQQMSYLQVIVHSQTRS